MTKTSHPDADVVDSLSENQRSCIVPCCNQITVVQSIINYVSQMPFICRHSVPCRITFRTNFKGVSRCTTFEGIPGYILNWSYQLLRSGLRGIVKFVIRNNTLWEYQSALYQFIIQSSSSQVLSFKVRDSALHIIQLKRWYQKG